MAFQLRDNEEVQLSAEALDSEGNPADVNTIWSTSDNSIAAVDANGLVTASPGAAGLGAATITASVTDNSDGDTLTGTFDIEVIGSDAVAVNITAGTPTPKAVEPPLIS